MKKTCAFILLSALTFVSGCSAPRGMSPAPAASDAMVGAYTLAPLDPIRITLLGIPEEKMFEAIIDETGEVTIPYINEPIKAAGLTVSGLERRIRQLYTDGAIYKNITVNVQTSAKTYYMEGEVRVPQEYPLPRRITLLQAIAAASGYTEYANKEDVTITRQGALIKINAKKLEKNPELDVPIEAGDRIKVGRSWY